MRELLAQKCLPDDLGATFATRVAHRDDPRPPEPLSQTPEAIADRVDHWLLTQHKLRDLRTRHALTQMLVLLLAQPEASTTALQEAAGLGPRSGARSTLRLGQLGLTTWTQRRHTRYHRLTRAAEDALLLVVLGPPVVSSPS